MKNSLLSLMKSHSTQTHKRNSQEKINEQVLRFTNGDLQVQFHYVLSFSKLTTQSQLEQVTNILRTHGYITLQAPSLRNDKILLFIYLCEPSLILEEAERMQMYKLTIDKQFDDVHEVHKKIVEKLHFKQKLDNKLIEQLNAVDPRILQYEKYRKFRYACKTDFINSSKDEEVLKLFSPSEQLTIIYTNLHHIMIGDIAMVHFLKQENYLIGITPIHEQSIQYTTNTEIQSYFGGNIAIYFEFMDYYQHMLIYIATLAIIKMIVDYYQDGITRFSYLYACCIMIWTTIFVNIWKRRESALGVEWGILDMVHNKKVDLNPEFKGVSQINLTTGLLEITYPHSSRLFYYLISIFEAIPILLIAGFIKLAVFNINGLIKNPKSQFYIQQLAALNQEGGILYSSYTGPVLDMFTILLIFYINLLYTKVCINSTRRENHKTNIDSYNSVILKRFMFELINRFFHLFYIAFVEFDIITLKTLLTKLFIMDQIRRVATELVLPMILKSAQNKSMAGQISNFKKKTDSEDYLVDRIAELDLWEYDDFDDYIEVMFQFGYIVLFAAIFPIASPLAYIFNLIEIWSDKFKLGQRLYQRNLPTRAHTIGQWKLVITILSILAIYTNTAFIALAHFNMFDLCQQQQCEWGNMLVILFLFEHLSMGIKYLIYKNTHQNPRWVRILLRRLRRIKHAHN